MNSLDILFTLGRPFGPVYSSIMTTRATLYKKNIFQTFTLAVPVISIGNLTMGGSGKTPVVLSLAKLLKGLGYNPAIISRGYGGTAKEKVNIVANGKDILLTPEEAGDEPFMLAGSLENVPVVTGTSRIFPCNYAIDELKANVLLLDDGFQHLSVKRDIDIVLFNATTLAGNSRVFPGGVLREPTSALGRCNAFMLTGVSDINRKRAHKFSRMLVDRFPGRPVFFSQLSQHKIWSADDNEIITDISTLNEAAGFCSIANPGRFLDSINIAGIKPVKFTAFRDHGKYNQRSLDKLCKKAMAAGAKCLLTTEKDFVKICDFKRALPLYVLKVQQQPDTAFEDYIASFLLNLP